MKPQKSKRKSVAQLADMLIILEEDCIDKLCEIEAQSKTWYLYAGKADAYRHASILLRKHMKKKGKR